mmetsp:Transcript_33845/g.75054  ORF Transcript_33845/g.75054 Transcript_33845/m.75054 type:complete len:222 (-) Transcript_33845:672-1337(-)
MLLAAAWGAACLINPGLDGGEDGLAAQPEVCLDDVLQLSRRVAQQVYHGVADVVLPHLLVVGPAVAVALLCAHAALKSWLIEVGLRHEDEGLDGEQDLQRGGGVCVPALPPTSLPGAQQGEAHLAGVVKVWVEAHAASTGGLQGDLRRAGRVVGREVHVKHEATVAVGRVLRPRDHEPPESDILLVHPDKHGRGLHEGQQLGQARQLLGQPDHAGLGLHVL